MASVMEAFNASATAFPDTMQATMESAGSGIMSKVLGHASALNVFFTLLVAAVIYDQSTRLLRAAIVPS